MAWLFDCPLLDGSIAHKDVAVDWAAGEDFIGVGFVNVRPRADEVTHIRRLKVTKAVCRSFRGIRRADEETNVAQFIRHHPEVGYGVDVKAVLAGDAKLPRPTAIGADVEGVAAFIVHSPNPKCEADLLQLVHALIAGFVSHYGFANGQAGLAEARQRPAALTTRK